MKIFQLSICRVYLSLIIFCYSSCKDAYIKSTATVDEIKIDSPQLKQTTEAGPLALKDFSLRFENLIQKNGLKQSPTLDQTGIKIWKIEEIDPFYDPLYKYHLLDTIMDSGKMILSLIAREYENENIIWLCSYAIPFKLIHAEDVYYDNAEGNYLLESELKNNKLTLYSDDINEGKKTEHFTFDSEFRLVPPRINTGD